ncbi:MAG: NifB/NifX family molybdenum-iron cluster-binding protein [Dissulfurimicrobium sp.]|uniref:NifB/NifX family molybdenum-iron cluster-binding protein n=1 Tax=Dissulfurimicrobium sp. TaxID=2022436 RepID=UPI00404B90E2
MKIAVSSRGQDLDAQVDPRFGRANYFLIIDVDSGKILEVIDNTASQNAAHGAGINAATLVANAGAEVVLTGQVGPKAFAVLDEAGIKVISDVSGTVREAVERFKSSSSNEVHSLDSKAPRYSAISGQGLGRGAWWCRWWYPGGRGMGGGWGRYSAISGQGLGRGAWWCRWWYPGGRGMGGGWGRGGCRWR